MKEGIPSPLYLHVPNNYIADGIGVVKIEVLEKHAICSMTDASLQIKEVWMLADTELAVPFDLKSVEVIDRDRIVNKSPEPHHTKTPNWLFLAEDATGKGYAKITIDPPVTDQDKGKLLLWKISGSGTASPLEGDFSGGTEPVSELTPAMDYVLYVAWDANGNETLDDVGDVIIFKSKISVFSTANYTLSQITLTTGAYLKKDEMPFATSLLYIFSGENPLSSPNIQYKPDLIGSKMAQVRDPRLTHKTGAPFNGDSSAIIAEYIYNDNSGPSNMMENSDEILEFIKRQIDVRKEDIKLYFNDKPVGTEYAFSFSTDNADIHFGGNDLYFSTAAAKVAISGIITIKKDEDGSLKIPSININGDIDDLYDFDYEAGGPSIPAATVQIGWNVIPSGSAGKIFFVKVKIDRAFTNFVYTF
jgi:hypothetical protein